ncbi:MAG: DUF1266 domain-containing protein [Aestuariibaculum sp.]
MKKILLLTLTSLLFFNCKSDKPNKEELLKVTKEHQMVYAWALNAILNYENSASDFIFSGEEKKTIHKSEYRKALVKWWNVKSGIDLKASIDALQNGQMHNQTFLGDYRDFFNFTEADLKAYLKENKEYNAIDNLVWSKKEQLQDKGIIAWDLVRAIGLIGWGYQADYLTDSEAYDYCLNISKKIQNNFSSYEEMADNYLVGYFFWTMDEAAYNKRKEIANNILKDSNSAWNTFPFNYDTTKM